MVKYHNKDQISTNPINMHIAPVWFNGEQGWFIYVMEVDGYIFYPLLKSFEYINNILHVHIYYSIYHAVLEMITMNLTRTTCTKQQTLLLVVWAMTEKTITSSLK